MQMLFDHTARSSRRGNWLVRLVALLCFLVGVTSGAFAQNGGFHGFVFSDDNGNGTMDVGEMPASHFVMSFVRAGETLWTETDANGQYRMDSVPLGRYQSVFPYSESMVFRAGEGQPGDPINFNIANGQNVGLPPVGIEKRCGNMTNIKILCDVQNPGCYIIDFDFKNLTPFTIYHMFVTNPAPVVVQSLNPPSGSPGYIPIPGGLAPNATTHIKIRLCGAQPQLGFCLGLTAHTQDLLECCYGMYYLDLPPCDCFQILDQTFECLPDGSYNWCFVLQNLVPTAMSPTVNWVTIVPPNGLTVNPVIVPLNPPLAYGQSQQVCVHVTGAMPNQSYDFLIGLSDANFRRCCSMHVKTTFPPCDCAVPGECAPNGFAYEGPAPNSWTPFVGFTHSAVTTQGLQVNGNTFPLMIVNLDSYQTAPPPLGQNWTPNPFIFTGMMNGDPTTHWDLAHLGSIFGVTIDSRGNIFVTATACYNGTNSVSDSTGQRVLIFKIENGTSKISNFVTTAQMPNAPAAGGPIPNLGNITYDWTNDQLFVTNHDDGRIYRITNLAAPTGTVMANPYDPFGADPNTPGFCPLGERLWGIQWHAGRVYFSRWVKDSARTGNVTDYANNVLTNNEIWSVALNGAVINPATLQKEIDVPNLPNANWSSPTSDIQFSRVGKMMLAERTVNGDTGSYAHSSRGLQYTCANNGGWSLDGGPSDLLFEVGTFVFSPDYYLRGSAGGTDYDYSTAINNNDPNSGARVWFTGDIVGSPANFGWVYGLKGMPLTGGNSANSILIDLLSLQKSSLGDIEIPCPPRGVNVSVGLGDYQGNPNGIEVTYQLRDHTTGAVIKSGNAFLNANGQFEATFAGILPNLVYDLSVKGMCWLRQAKSFSFDENGSGDVAVTLISGDIDDDNEVGPGDFGLLSGAYGTLHGDPAFNSSADLDGDGEIGPSDFGILTTNWGLVGD